jgi:hypothetical protein
MLDVINSLFFIRILRASTYDMYTSGGARWTDGWLCIREYQPGSHALSLWLRRIYASPATKKSQLWTPGRATWMDWYVFKLRALESARYVFDENIDFTGKATKHR